MVVLCWQFFVSACSVTFHIMCVHMHIIFSSVKVAEWPHFGKELPTICNLS